MGPVAYGCDMDQPPGREPEFSIGLVDGSRFAEVRELLADLELAEQPHYPDHPQLSREELLEATSPIRPRFSGENVILGVFERSGGSLAGFCWCVLFDPGTGLEGEVAEVYVRPEHRRRGLAAGLLSQAVALFRSRGVTLGYVWTRHENQEAVRLYEKAGFKPSRQLVLTWYPEPEAG